MHASSTPVHHDPTPTEAAAARRAGRFAQTLEARVLALVVAAGDEGITAQEARIALGLPVERQYSVSPRLSALAKKGLVERTDDARDHFQTYRVTAAGRQAVAA